MSFDTQKIIENRYVAKNPIIFVLIFLGLRVLLAFIFLYISERLGEESRNNFAFDNIAEEFLIVVCIAPLAETSLFQYAPYKLLHKYIRLRYVILLSSLLFAAMHYYSALYFVNGILAGFLYSFVFCFLRNSKPLVYTAAIHISYNFISFIFNHLHS